MNRDTEPSADSPQDAVIAPPGSSLLVPATPLVGGTAKRPPRRRWRVWIRVIPILVALGCLAAYAGFQQFPRARAIQGLQECRTHQKNIATALEMYSTDNGGRFPTSLELLIPRYLKKIPTCPAAGDSRT